MSENAVPPVKQRLQLPWKWLRSLSLPMRILVMVASFVLLTVTANLFSSALSPLFRFAVMEGWSRSFSYDPSSPPNFGASPDELKQNLEENFRDIEVLERSITVTSSAEEVQIAFRLVIPKEDPHAAIFASDWHGGQAIRTGVLFGEVSVDGSPLTDANFRSSQWEVDPAAESMIVTLRAVFPDINYPVGISFQAKEEDEIQPAVDKLLIEMSDSVLAAMYPIPDQASQGKASIVKQAPEELPNFSLGIDRSGVATGNDSNQNIRMSRRSFLLRVSSLVGDLPFISRLLLALSKSVPILLFLWLAGRLRKNADASEKNPNVQTLLALGTVLLVFHFTLHLSAGLGDWLRSVHLFTAWEGGLKEFAWHLTLVFFVQLGTVSWRIQMVILGLLAPALFILIGKAEPASGPRRWTRSRVISVFLTLLLFAAIVGAALVISARVQSPGMCADALDQILFPQYAPPQGDGSTPPPIYVVLTCGIPAWTWSIILLGTLLLVLRWILGALLRAATGERHPLLAWAATAVIALSAFYRMYLELQPEARASENAVWLMYTIALGTFLLWSFARYIHSVYQKLGLHWKPSASTARWLFLGLVLLAIPARFVFESVPTPEGEFLTLVYYLDDLLLLAWVAGILFLLYEDGKSDLKLETEARLYGSLALSTLLFSTSARWLYIPITFLLGWLAIQWLLASGHNWGSIEEQFKKMSRVRSNLIKHGSLVRVLDQAYLQYRKDRIDKLAKGELKPRKFKTDLSTWERDQKTVSRTPNVKLDREISKHPLAFGPKATAWENGLHGAFWATLLALPWFIIYVVNFMRGSSYSIAYPLLDFFIDLLTIFGRWASIGFVLGYFFPYLRGHSGLEKGLWLALALTVPTLPLYFIINNSAAAWQAALFWALQVLIECILLGLIAFDYSTVHQERRGFQLLLELHGMRSLSLWVATLIAAIGTSALTLLSSQAVTLIGLTLKTFLPDVPVEFSPNP